MVATVQTRTYCPFNSISSNCRYMGPTIVTKPGVWVNITLINHLHGIGRLGTIKDFTFEAFHDPDVVNLHTHGLHVDSHVDGMLFIMFTFITPYIHICMLLIR